MMFKVQYLQKHMLTVILNYIENRTKVSRNSKIQTQADSNKSDGDAILPSNNGLKGFLNTYFTGNNMGNNILEKLTNVRKIAAKKVNSRMRSQGYAGRKYNDPTSIYS